MKLSHERNDGKSEKILYYDLEGKTRVKRYYDLVKTNEDTWKEQRTVPIHWVRPDCGCVHHPFIRGRFTIMNQSQFQNCRSQKMPRSYHVGWTTGPWGFLYQFHFLGTEYIMKR